MRILDPTVEEARDQRTGTQIVVAATIVAFLIVFVAIVVALGAITTARAADMPVRKAPVYAAPVATPSWQGFYVSIDGGWNLGKFSPVFGTRDIEATAINLDDNSAFVGGSMRYLFQTGSFVIGPELGLQWWGFKSQAELVPAGEGTAAVLLQSKIDWLAYAGARAGLTPFQGTLIYLSGGVAWAHQKGETINLAKLDAISAQSLTGWYIGAGLEFRITDNVTFGGEYRHLNFGDVQPIVAVGVPTDKLTIDQALARLSFKLN
jgi:outer membrane immunogenic protein